MQDRYRAVIGALTITFALIGVTTVVEADEETPTTTTPTAAPEPPPVDVVIEIEPEEPIEAPKEAEQAPPPAPVAESEPAPAEPVVDPAAEEPAAAPAPAEPAAEEQPATEDPVDESTTDIVGATTTTVGPHHSADQETIVTGTQVAVGNSGGNQTHNGGTPTGGSVALGTEIDTGSADAVGSSDENIIEQQADVVLTDQAVANILQIALIINIGAALANSGVNDIFSTPGGSGNPGAIGTGDATAIGNDTDQYVTQAARTAATQEMDDFANQLAISLWLGLAQANSGLNAVTGTGVSGSGGSVGAGDATAVGNDSLTDISQRAAVVGSGTSQTDITQRATVMNLGFALANSGLNSISGVAGGLLSASDADDDAIAEDLFAMLLPALLQSYGYGPSAGSGSVNTGDATAIGNQSETYVAQIAAAASSGDGLNRIVQEVLVANMGAAGANTGANTLGGARASLDPQTAAAVVKMAAFLASMLSIVHTATGSTALQLQSQGIEIPFGDLIFQISGALDGFDTELTSETGARARIRQISIVLSLGVAKSNSGLNAGVTVQEQGQALDSTVSAARVAAVNSELAAIGAAATDAAVDTAGDAINTGDVEAGNVDNLVIICQRINAEDVDCLAPPPPSPPPPPPGVTTTTVAVGSVSTVVAAPTTAPSTTQPALAPPVAGGNPPSGLRAPAPSAAPLPSTGSDVDTILWGAAILVLLGGCLVLVRRRKAPQEV